MPILSRPTSSYSELMSMSLPWMEVKAYCRKRHLYSSPLYLSLQMLMGDFASTFEIWKRVLASSEKPQTPVQGLDAFMKVPESATVQSTSGFFNSDRTQLLQEKVAIPPEEAPVRSTFSAAAKSYWEEIHLKCDLVLASPLKQRVASLQEMASLLQPWWWAPSQQKMMNLVHVANLFSVVSVERYPPGERMLSGRSLLLPVSPLLRLQHYSSTWLRVVPAQYPPPTKKMRNLLLSPPSCRQSAGEVPSRHLALGSELWMIFLQGCSAANTQKQRTASRIISNLPIDLIIYVSGDEDGTRIIHSLSATSGVPLPLGPLHLHLHHLILLPLFRLIIILRLTIILFLLPIVIPEVFTARQVHEGHSFLVEEEEGQGVVAGKVTVANPLPFPSVLDHKDSLSLSSLLGLQHEEVRLLFMGMAVSQDRVVFVIDYFHLRGTL